MTIPTPAASPTQRLGDRQLLERIATRDREAFETLYRRFQPRLARYVYRVCRRAEAVDEVVNDTMLAVWRGADRFQGRSKVSTWLLGIAYRLTLKSLARERRQPESVEAGILEERPAPSGWGPERRELRLTLEAALDSLSVEHRTVVELTYLQGLSCPEAAQVVGIPVGTVKTRMFHARKALRRLLAAPPRAGLDVEENES